MSSSGNNQGSASLRTDVNGEGTLTLTIAGRLDSHTTGSVWREAGRVLGPTPPPRIVVDASGIEYCDGSGIGFLLELRVRQLCAGGEVEIHGLAEEFQTLLDQFDPLEFEKCEREERQAISIPEEAGRATVKIWQDIRTITAFVGEVVVALLYAIRHPRKVRWKDAVLVAEKAGVNALPIIVLLGFLMGLIIGFQSVIPLRKFGAQVFLAQLVGLSTFKELGPLVVGIVLAARSGSAIAAELGTMKVNEELDALTTMGLDPVRFLVVTRVMMIVFVAPLLTVFADLAGLVGGAVVFTSLGYTLSLFVDQLMQVATYVDLLGGLIKATAYGLLVAGVGCLRGLQTATGAQAVGDSTTRAVVAGIILIIITDGIFSAVFYYLGIG
jgi:phospholipid/cholesterol/gamma-HCH transport system permease protein